MLNSTLQKLSSLPLLRTLAFINVGVTDEGLSALTECDFLQSITLYGHVFTETGVNHLNKVPLIHQLRIIHATDQTLKHLARLTRVRQIRISNKEGDLSQQDIQKLQQQMPWCKIVWDGGAIDETDEIETGDSEFDIE